MRFLASVVVVGLAGVMAFGGKKDKPPELVMTESDEGRFRVAFSNTPKVNHRSLQSAAGRLEVTSFSSTVSPDLTLSVTYADYPESFDLVSRETLFAAVRDGMKPKGGKVVEEGPLKPRDSTPAGTQLLIDCGRYFIKARLYRVDTRLYLVTATGKKSELEDTPGGTTAGKFLASFQIRE
jgi:hypothetical protein